MTCPRCHAVIEGLGCRACLERVSHHALLQQQQARLAALLADPEARLDLTRPMGMRDWHVLMRGVKPARTFCGTASDPQWKKLTRAYEEIWHLHICPSCADAIAGLDASLTRSTPS